MITPPRGLPPTPNTIVFGFGGRALRLWAQLREPCPSDRFFAREVPYNKKEPPKGDSFLI